MDEKIDKYSMKSIIAKALLEDIGSGDITTQLTIPQELVIEADIIAHEEGIIGGLEIAGMTFKFENENIKFTPQVDEGEYVYPEQLLAKVHGPARAILTAERVALNFLQRISGIATWTSKYVKAVERYSVKIYDTRKTTPCLRILDKYGVRVGGGYNHRFGLYDEILIKENHIKIAGGIKKAVDQVKLEAENRRKCIEVETQNIDEVKEAVSADVDIIMLDNMDIQTMKEAVKIIKKSNKDIIIEASGGITLDNVQEIAKTGVDRISVGAVTHSPTVLDISLEVSSNVY